MAALSSTLSGSLIRERRLALQLRQADVAARAGISASYLNLIEHNRRRIGSDVLERLAAALAIEATALAEGAGGALIDELRAAAAAAPAAQAELDRAEDFAGRFPGWAAVLTAEHRRAAQLERAVGQLNDRLTHDPHLSAALHELLSALASVRSTAAILADTEDIDPEWRARFHRNLHQDSERLAHGTEALVAYLDGSEATNEAGIAAPQEELEAWLSGRDWQLSELEPEGANGGLATLQVEIAQLVSHAARQLAGDFLRLASFEAQALPKARLQAALSQHGEDPGLIAQTTGVPVLTVMRRMALMPGSGVGLVLCDASGTLLFRKPIEGFAPPRFGAACPLWPLFAALARPQAPQTALIETAGRVPRLFRTLSYCEVRLPLGFAGPQLREAAMLLIPQDVLPDGSVATAVGTSCRICPHGSCPARREPSILSEAI